MTSEPSPAPTRCVARVEWRGIGSARRAYAFCPCGWRTGLLLTAMQAYSAARDHDGAL